MSIITIGRLMNVTILNLLDPQSVSIFWIRRLMKLDTFTNKKKRYSDIVWPSLDPDDIFQDFCTGNGSLDFSSSPNPNDPLNTCDSELGDLVNEYLNRQDVQTALGVRRTVWSQCSFLNYNFNRQSMVPYYKNIFMNKPDISILIYSGDLDILTVPFAYTQPCLLQMGKQVVSWQPWFVNGATAGYVEVYDKFTYATVKGGGHETPLYQPLSSYNLIYRFMTNGNLDGLTAKYQPKLMGTKREKKYLKQSDMLRYYGFSSLRKYLNK